MPRGEQLDLLLLHAPSVYDFREMSIFYGPISDMIPSSTVFEMYPLGFLTIASYLQKQRMRVRIVNLAARMMKGRSFSVPRFLASQHPRAIGIDLHWLPHAHGALEVAKIAKEIHPDVPVLMGGLSSTYFHQELIGYPQVDYVLRGDSTEAPLYELLLALRNGRALDQIPNLTWKQRGIMYLTTFCQLCRWLGRHLWYRSLGLGCRVNKAASSVRSPFASRSPTKPPQPFSATKGS